MSTAAYDENVASQPDVVAQLLAEASPQPLDPRRPLVLTGIGTSLHACQVTAAWVRQLTGGRVRAVAVDAHDLAFTEPLTADDQVVVVSHRGTKQRPNEVLRRAREIGARTVAVTGRGPARPEADEVLRTCEQERASTHTVSYTAALAVLGRLIAVSLGEEGEPLADALRAAPDAMRRTLDLPAPDAAVEALVRSGPDPVLVTGTGLDAVTAQEVALKVKEGTYRWAEGMHTEFALHGTPAVFRTSTVAYLIRPGSPDGGRSEQLAVLLSQIGARVLWCSTDAGADLPFAAVPRFARPLVACLPFHRLVSSAAAGLGASPDLTHLESEPWASAVRAVSL